jgi:succinate dehydrogenase/fumarate reductase cytochrome b subunit
MASTGSLGEVLGLCKASCFRSRSHTDSIAAILQGTSGGILFLPFSLFSSFNLSYFTSAKELLYYYESKHVPIRTSTRSSAAFGR